MKDGTWVNSIVKAMTELGGKARYDDLYQQVAKVRKKELQDMYNSNKNNNNNNQDTIN